MYHIRRSVLFTGKTKMNNKPPWMNDQVRQQLKKKKSAFELYKKSKDGIEYIKYAKQRKKSRFETRRAVKEYEKEVVKLPKKDPKSFYKFVNSKLKTRARIPDLEGADGLITKKDGEKAKAFNDFFSSVFTNEELQNVPVQLLTG